MTIEIAARLNPFCHLPGTTCVIPLTSVQVQVFPTVLKFLDLATGKLWEEKLQWKGPVEQFTVQLDLEKGFVAVFGKTAEGFRRLWLKASSEGLQMTGDQEKIVPLTVMKKPEHIEKLSLGKHSQLDWELMCRKMDMEVMTPVLFQLGQLVPKMEAVSPILSLLQFSDKRDVAPQLASFFKAGFYGILSPRLQDDDHQGIVEEGKVEGCALALLSQGYRAVRALFFDEAEEHFSILPNLPPPFHAGRLIRLQSSRGDQIAFEWSKKLLKKVIIKPAASREVFLDLQKSLYSYRVNKGKRQDLKKPLLFEAGKTLFLDRFEK